MKRFLILLVLIVVVFTSLSVSAQAYTVIKRTDLSVDESISDQSQKKLGSPNKIYITRVLTPNDEYEDDSTLWIQSLYYYSITRLGFLDIPYTYLVDRDGKIFEGRNGGVYTDPETELKTGTLVIGYLSNSEDVTALASQSLKQIINENSYIYGIPRKDVDSKKLFISNVEGGIAKTQFKDDDSDFGNSLRGILNTFAYSHNAHQNYKASVKSVTYNKSVKSTEKFTVEVVFENKNDFPWFSNTDYIYLSTKGSKESSFAVNGKWESFSKPTFVSDKVIMPNEELRMTYEMQGMLLPGKYTEKFNLMVLPKSIFAGSEFSVTFNIERGNNKLVKIVNIPSLNVRSCIGPSCEIITQVAENQIFIMEEKNAGWYKIKYSDRKSGWVFGQYVQEL